MNSAEKRYFKVFTSRHLLGGHSNQQVLFDAISEMPIYDEAALRDRFKGQPLLNRFAITKRRLYEAVLNSLDAYHATRSIDARLYKALHHVELLYKRALYDDALKALHGLEKIARDHDRLAILIHVVEWERRAMERTNYEGVTLKDLTVMADRAKSIRCEEEEIDRLWQLKSRSFLVLYREGRSLNEQAITELTSLKDHPLLVEGASLHSPKALFLHHHVRSALAYSSNDLEECERQLITNATILKENARRFIDEPGLVLGVMGNLATVRMRMGKFQQALDGFREFKRMPLLLPTAPSPDLEMKLFVMGTSLELSVHAAKGQFKEALEMLEPLGKECIRLGNRLSTVRRGGLMLQAAYMCFGAGQHEKALRWCNRLLNEKGIEAHVELHTLGRMLNLAVLIELDRSELLPYVIRNTRRALRTSKHGFSLEMALLDLAQHSLQGRVANKKTDLWTEFIDRSVTLAKDPQERQLLEQVDLISWAQSKIGPRTFPELVKERWLAIIASSKKAA